MIIIVHNVRVVYSLVPLGSLLYSLQLHNITSDHRRCFTGHNYVDLLHRTWEPGNEATWMENYNYFYYEIEQNLPGTKY